jgi:hypothetical protein
MRYLALRGGWSHREFTLLMCFSSDSLQGRILPFPRADMSFPTSRDLLIYLHASAQQHEFHVFRKSPCGSDVKLACRMGHTQSKHRPLCQARYHIARKGR